MVVLHHFDFQALNVPFSDLYSYGLFLEFLSDLRIAKIDSRIFRDRQGVVFRWRDAAKCARSAGIRNAITPPE